MWIGLGVVIVLSVVGIAMWMMARRGDSYRETEPESAREAREARDQVRKARGDGGGLGLP